MGFGLIIIITLFAFIKSKILALFALTVFTVFSQIPYLAPRLNRNLYQPYELWIFVLIIFYIFLPEKVALYLYE